MRSGYSTKRRELIRKKLTRYMEENRIGLPTLAKRITDANPEHEIQITTLQRFLTAQSLHRRPDATEAGLAKQGLSSSLAAHR
jgi:hypothetical protein